MKREDIAIEDIVWATEHQAFENKLDILRSQYNKEEITELFKSLNGSLNDFYDRSLPFKKGE